MKKTANAVLAAFVLTLVTPGLTMAVTVDFTDRAAWETAAGAAPTLTDDFNELTADVWPTGDEIARSGYTIGNV